MPGPEQAMDPAAGMSSKVRIRHNYQGFWRRFTVGLADGCGGEYWLGPYRTIEEAYHGYRITR